MMLLTLAAAVMATNASTLLTSGRIAVLVSNTTTPPSYSVLVDGAEWFTSTEGNAGGFAYCISGKCVAASALHLHSTTSSSGTDGAGDFTALTLNWSSSSLSSSSSQPQRPAAAAGATAEWATTFKAYTDKGRSAIVFQQTWLVAMTGTAGGSTFPSLSEAPGFLSSTGTTLGTLEYTGSSCGFMVGAKSKFQVTGGPSKGYIVVAPQDLDRMGSNATLAIGPVTEHFVNQAHMDESALCYGLGHSFEGIPAGYTLETVLVVSDASPKPERVSVPAGGVNSALFAYGDFVLDRHSKQRTKGNHNVETTYVGYSTTAFYFYNLCDCAGPVGQPVHNRERCHSIGGKSPIPAQYLDRSAIPGTCDSYQDTLLAVDSALKEQGIPYKHMLLDSWWYGEGVHGGAWLWEDVPECVNISFPQTMRSFRDQIGPDKVIWVHNGKWTNDSPYREKYDFVPGGPPQGRGVWDHVFKANHEGWGLETIKQDHMGQQIEATAGGNTNISVLKDWLLGMGEGASANNVSVLYCCAPPNVHMTGVTVPAAFGVRASPDYVWAPSDGHVLKLPTVQWALGPDNAFHWNGLGLLPYKDTFFSNSTMTQTSGQWTNDSQYWPPFAGYHELNAQTHALMSLLSMAQVTFGDAVGQSNKTLLMRLMREDGMILKADRPATAIDAQFQAMMFGGWPGSHPPSPSPSPSPPGTQHEYLSLSACTGAATEIFTFNSATGGFSEASGSKGCVDISGCNSHVGAAVHIFRAPQHMPWSCGVGPGGTCDAKNERWQLKPAAGHAGVSMIVSEFSGMCLRVGPGAAASAATAETCSTTDPYQLFVATPAATADDDASAKVKGKVSDVQTVTLAIANAITAVCVTAGPLPPALAAAPAAAEIPEVWHGFDSQDEVKAAVAARYPAGSSGSHLSDSYKAAYTISAEYLERANERDAAIATANKKLHEECNGGVDKAKSNAANEDSHNVGDGVGGEQCPGGVGAPQGPVGEVYSTHTTIPGTGCTWRYVIGVQLSADFNVTEVDVGLGVGSNGAAAAAGGECGATYSVYTWSDANSFKPTAAAEVRPFSASSPLLLKESNSEQCHTGQGQMDVTTTCFHAQWHTIAPVFTNGWTLLGEVGKFIPISRQRIANVQVLSGEGQTSVEVALRGAPGEKVTFGAVPKAGGGPIYETVTVDSDGTAKIVFK